MSPSFGYSTTDTRTIQVGRTFWSLARDNATPFPKIFGIVNETLSCPVPATLLTGLLTNALGAITLGSKTAFSDLAGSFVILSTASYAMCFIPNMLTGRRNIPPGAFWMGKAGFVVNGLASLFIILFNIMFCFPYALPTTVASMNYNSVILVGVFTLTLFWWLVHGLRNYPGPKLGSMYGIGDERRLSKI
jgi:choline transport protein